MPTTPAASTLTAAAAAAAVMAAAVAAAASAAGARRGVEPVLEFLGLLLLPLRTMMRLLTKSQIILLICEQLRHTSVLHTRASHGEKMSRRPYNHSSASTPSHKGGALPCFHFDLFPP